MSAVITWLGHAAFKLEYNGTVVLFDPWLKNPKAPENVKLDKVDAILISHGHFDHVGDTVALAKEHNAKVYCIHEISQYLLGQGVDPALVIGMNKGGTVDINGLKATMVNAIHSGACGTAHPLVPGGDAGGFVVTVPNGHSIYHAGDTDVFGDMKIVSDLYKPDVALLPIGGHYTMGPQGAAYAINNLLLTVKIVVPMHFGTFPLLAGTPSELQRGLTRKDVNICKLNPGESFALEGRPVESLFA
eukprot:Colp12_sorted_trinity150504_noHs@10585